MGLTETLVGGAIALFPVICTGIFFVGIVAVIRGFLSGK